MFKRARAIWWLKFLTEESKYIEIPRIKYEKPEIAHQNMSIPHYTASDFIRKQIDEALEKYGTQLARVKVFRREIM